MCIYCSDGIFQVYIYIYTYIFYKICKGIWPRGSKYTFLQGGMDVCVYINIATDSFVIFHLYIYIDIY